MSGSKPLLFFSTFGNEEAAVNFAHTAVRERYAACVNVIGGMRSVYFWDGKINDENEFLVIGKTSPAQFKKLKLKFKSMHSYDVPELISVKIDDGLPKYLKWISETLKK